MGHSLASVDQLTVADRARLADEIGGGGSTIEVILRRAAQSLGVVTQELGVAIGPRFEQAVLRRIDLVRLSSDRLLMVLTLDRGAIRTIFVEVPGDLVDEAIAEVSRVLNERLAGLQLTEISNSLAERLRDATSEASDGLLNVFVAGGARLFDAASASEGRSDVLIGQPSLLADQPEFASGERMRRLIELTETPDELGALLRQRATLGSGLSITIGDEHGDPRMEPFTVVTAEYSAGGLSGVIGVIGPTRMPYEKVVSLVSHTSRLVSDLLH
jgi:heat-inducible transcriptional repressor